MKLEKDKSRPKPASSSEEEKSQDSMKGERKFRVLERNRGRKGKRMADLILTLA